MKPEALKSEGSEFECLYSVNQADRCWLTGERIEFGVVLLLHLHHFDAGEHWGVLEIETERRVPGHEMVGTAAWQQRPCES